MEEKKENGVLLDLMQRAAFSVESGVITHVNAAASRYLLQPGTEIAPMLATGKEEYAERAAQLLYLTLNLEGCTLGATVARTTDADIFVLEESADTAQLQTLALAAMELRQPLASAIAMAERLLPNASPEQQDAAAQLNRRMMQLQRIIGNMSDGVDSMQSNARLMESMEICGFLEELLAKTKEALSHAGITLHYDLPQDRIYTLANPQKLERAVYNMLSNAAKFSPADGKIQAQLARHGKRLAFSVTDQGQGIPAGSDIFSRYLRQPALEDPRFGLGLGMLMVRSAAAFHGGAVLVDRPDGAGTRVTMTWNISQNQSAELRSPAFRIDYAGERDHCLLELSDVLPAALYRMDAAK